jgi:hypothetical protein
LAEFAVLRVGAGQLDGVGAQYSESGNPRSQESGKLYAG